MPLFLYYNNIQNIFTTQCFQINEIKNTLAQNLSKLNHRQWQAE